ncbi:hypothetical protein GGE65_008369 [Skermanella aerolata]|uniref:hypothetical protein n=1 Tax=Skermanella aerolata TaxID=393310 RepID=UPI003D214D35
MTLKLQQCNVARAMDTPDDNTGRNSGNTRTELSMRDAARFVRLDKGTLSRHQKSGKVTGRKDEQGRLWFEPSELMRAYPNVDYVVAGNVAERNESPTPQQAPQQAQQDTQQPLIEELRRQIGEQKLEREREREQYQDTIADLRRRLDQEAEERRRVTLLLTDQREKESQTAAPEPPKRRGLMTRLLGGLGRE